MVCSVCGISKSECKVFHPVAGLCNHCYREARRRNAGIKVRPKRTKEDQKRWSRESYHRRKDAVNAKKRKERAENPEKFKQEAKKWKENNLEKTRAYYRNYQSQRRIPAVKNSTLSQFKQEIQEIYKNCPEGMEVDHMVPLIHPDVCGLHAPWNLQYLTREENAKKSNKFLPQYRDGKF